MTVAAPPLIAIVNHLLARESWARDKLLPYAGRRARVRMPLGTLEIVVLADGLLGPVAPAVASDGDAAGARRTGTSADGASGTSAAGFRTGVPGASLANLPNRTSGVAAAVAAGFDVTITVEAGVAPAFLSGGQQGAMKYVRIDGDAEFATALGYLAEHLRWEPEEDLAKFVGDAGAHRAATFAREFAQRARRTGRNLLESIAEYLLDEDPQLVRRGELGTFGADLTRTRDALARLEKRLERLERQPPTRNLRAVRSAAAKPDSTGGAH